MLATAISIAEMCRKSSSRPDIRYSLLLQMCHARRAPASMADPATNAAKTKPPRLYASTPTTLHRKETLACEAKHTGQPLCSDVSSILTRQASCTYRSVHLHTDLRGAGSLSVQMKHSGGDGNSSSTAMLARVR
jgi:hypothetical protein